MAECIGVFIVLKFLEQCLILPFSLSSFRPKSLLLVSPPFQRHYSCFPFNNVRYLEFLVGLFPKHELFSLLLAFFYVGFFSIRDELERFFL